MARPCTVCEHPEMETINRAVVDLSGNPKRFRILSEKYGLRHQSIRRHVETHMTEGLRRAVVRHAELVEETSQLDVMAALGRAAQKLERFLGAADAWLTDPRDPTRYDLGPRDGEVFVIWEKEVDMGGGVRAVVERKKESLADILRRCGEKSTTAPQLGEIRAVEVKHGDPRKLLLDAMTAGKPLLELIGKATGQIKPEPPAAQLNVFLGGPDWARIEETLVATLRPWPPALEAAGKALREIGGEG